MQHGRAAHRLMCSKRKGLSTLSKASRMGGGRWEVTSWAASRPAWMACSVVAACGENIM